VPIGNGIAQEGESEDEALDSGTRRQGRACYTSSTLWVTVSLILEEPVVLL
jgi:hypothetical protein